MWIQGIKTETLQEGKSRPKLQKHVLGRREQNISLRLPLGPLWPQSGQMRVLVLRVRVESHCWHSCCGRVPRYVCKLPWFLQTAAVGAAGGLVKMVWTSAPESWVLSPLLAEHQSVSQREHKDVRKYCTHLFYEKSEVDSKIVWALPSNLVSFSTGVKEHHTPSPEPPSVVSLLLLVWR